ncbi:hypothetical protein [Rhizobium tubonense]|uniref:Uncharacterized protein n=1 Tax=Rhizobium tubonense TaxID=484088 RepID=A0A2W4C4J5_9HYPH|nr:hypothetical protein [Rhizobium tubonense]PZM08589.1 hypothetical protein CPY51_28325 [Rhizobium tubonense]
MSKHSNASLWRDWQFTPFSLVRLFRGLVQDTSRVWNGNRRDFDGDASAAVRSNPDRLMLKGPAFSRGDIAAPASTEELKARAVKLQARIDAARLLLRAREV